MGRRIIVTIALMIWAIAGQAQVDVTKYVSDDLFSLRPTIETDEYATEIGTQSSMEELIEEGFRLIEEDEIEEAVAFFEERSRINSGSPIFPYITALVELERDSVSRAQMWLNRSIAIDPLFMDAKFMLGMIEISDGSVKEARDIFTRLKEASGYEGAAYYGLAQVSIENQNAFGAIRNFRKCLDVDPSYTDAYMPLITLELIYQNSPKSALKVINSGLEEFPEWEELIISRAIIASIVFEDFTQFSSDIDRLVELAPDNYHYRLMRGYYLLESGADEEGVRVISRALNEQLNTSDVGAYNFTTKQEHDTYTRDCLNMFLKEFEALSESTKS